MTGTRERKREGKGERQKQWHRLFQREKGRVEREK